MTNGTLYWLPLTKTTELVDETEIEAAISSHISKFKYENIYGTLEERCRKLGIKMFTTQKEWIEFANQRTKMGHGSLEIEEEIKRIKWAQRIAEAYEP